MDVFSGLGRKREVVHYRAEHESALLRDLFGRPARAELAQGPGRRIAQAALAAVAILLRLENLSYRAIFELHLLVRAKVLGDLAEEERGELAQL